MRNVAVILAGGVGERMGLDIPKQFLKVSGKPIMDHTLLTFNNHPRIDEVIVMITKGWAPEAKKIADKYDKVSAVIEGGATRNDTSRIALEHIADDDCFVVFHDAVRPFVSDKIIDDCLKALETYNAVDVAIPSADTIIKINDDIIEEIPDRSTLRRGQTPQAFRLSTIRKAYDIAQKDKDFKATDDCGVVLKYLPDEPIFVVDGDEANIKVTHPLDASIADKLFQLNSAAASNRSDEERKKFMKDKVMVVFGGSYGIGAAIAEKAEAYGARVHSFSRTATNTDVANLSDVIEALSETFEKESRIDFVINTAGQLSIGELEKMNDEDIEKLTYVNYIGPLFIAKYAKPYLVNTKGQILLFTSSSYTRGRATYSVYSSTKAAVVNLTQALAEEWADIDVKINCMNPERTATPMRTNAFGNEDKKTLLDAETVATASIDALLSSATGQVFDVRLR